MSINTQFIKLSNYLHNHSLCVVCVHMYEGVLCVWCTCVCAYVEAEGQLWVLFLIDHPPWICQDLSLARVCQLGSANRPANPWGSPASASQCWRSKRVLPHSAVLHGCWGPNTGPHAASAYPRSSLHSPAIAF